MTANNGRMATPAEALVEILDYVGRPLTGGRRQDGGAWPGTPRPQDERHSWHSCDTPPDQPRQLHQPLVLVLVLVKATALVFPPHIPHIPLTLRVTIDRIIYPITLTLADRTLTSRPGRQRALGWAGPLRRPHRVCVHQRSQQRWIRNS